LSEDVYPEGANSTGSIVLFGLIAKEPGHAQSVDEKLQKEHNHAAIYTSTQHYWNLIAARSLAAYRVKLHASTHSGYTTMYVYLAQASPSKPIAEVDGERWMSPAHPRGDQLRRLLKAGEKSEGLTASRRRRTGGAAGSGGSASGAAAPAKRIRDGDILEICRAEGIRSCSALQALAKTRMDGGNAMLGEFCTARGAVRLGELVEAAWQVIDPPTPMGASSRLGKLEAAASNFPCVCGGIWAAAASRVLQNNNVDLASFCRDICRALQIGACRGVNIQLVGGPGMGKSFLFEPLDRIFNTFPKPLRDNPYSFGDLPGSDIMLWQDFKYKTNIIAWEDLLSIFVGEAVNLRVFRKPPVKHRNEAPLFLTARNKLGCLREDPQEQIDVNQAMDERFKIYQWTTPLPMAERRPDFPKCGRCCARFYREGAASAAPAAGPAGLAAPAAAAPAAPS
jgi:hypothetical protein